MKQLVCTNKWVHCPNWYECRKHDRHLFLKGDTWLRTITSTGFPRCIWRAAERKNEPYYANVVGLIPFPALRKYVPCFCTFDNERAMYVCQFNKTPIISKLHAELSLHTFNPGMFSYIIHNKNNSENIDDFPPFPSIDEEHPRDTISVPNDEYFDVWSHASILNQRMLNRDDIVTFARFNEETEKFVYYTGRYDTNMSYISNNTFFSSETLQYKPFVPRNDMFFIRRKPYVSIEPFKPTNEDMIKHIITNKIGQYRNLIYNVRNDEYQQDWERKITILDMLQDKYEKDNIG